MTGARAGTEPAGPRAAPEEEPDEPLFRLPRPRPGLAVAGLRLLRTRNGILALLAVVALSLLFVELGSWQYHRHEGKVERRDLVRANYDAAAVPVTDLLGTRALAPGDQWRRVTAVGRYEPQGRLVVRNRPLDGRAGFHELVPLRLADGRLLVVDRGWLPAADGAGRPDAAPAPPAGPVEVTARVRPFEPPSDRTAPAGQLSRIDRAQVERALTVAGIAGPVLGGYAVLAAESPAPASGPVPLPRPDVDLGVHLAYAYQWWIFAVLLYVVLAVALYREAERREPDNSGTIRTQAGPSDADKTPRDVTVRVEGPPSE